MTKQEVLMEYYTLEKKRYAETYRHLNRQAKKGQIVFAGSSLMQHFPIYEFIQDYDIPYTIYNRGISGTTTQEYEKELDTCVFDLEPRLLVINIGTNDLTAADYKLEEMIARYERILRTIQARLPNIRLLLLAYYPGNPSAAPAEKAQAMERRSNANIRLANLEVKKLAGRVGARFCDLNSAISDDEGNLIADYTIDGVHMYSDGYEQVLKLLLPILQEEAEKLGLTQA